MKVGDSVVYKGNHYYPGLKYGNSYIISELIDDDYENDVIVEFEGLPDTYGFLTDFIPIKKERKLKLQKINGSNI